MLFYYVILLLLYWPSANGSEDVVDQVAVASGNLDSPISKNESHEIVGSLSSAERNDTAINSENLNEFVTMTSSSTPFTSDFTSEQEKVSSAETKKPSTKAPFRINVSNDSMTDFSAEARILMNLPHAGANRRSFDVQNDQEEFEILKVNDKTPAVANYNEFYETFQKNKETKSEKTPTKNFSYFRQKERMKQIDNIMAYGDNQNKNPEHYSHYYSQNYGNIQDTLKKNYEQEKVRNHHGVASDYDIFSESVTRQRSTNLPPSSYDAENPHSSWKPAAPIGPTYQNNRNSKPSPIVVGPTAYSYTQGSSQYTAKVPESTTTESSYNYQKSMSEDRYDRNEDYSGEDSDYYEITERPRRLHKSRRKPYSESSRKLPKEHRGDSSESKKQTSTRPKLHRSKPKQNYWSEEQPSQESSEEDSRENERDNNNNNNDNNNNNSNNNNNNKNNNNQEDKNSWSQVGPNVEFSQSNGYELGQADKSNVLVPINLNLVPITNFDHATALGNSQGFDMTNVGMPGFVSSGSVVSTAAPLVSSIQPMNIQNLPQGVKHAQNFNNGNYAYSTAVPDIVVGQNSFQNPVQTILVHQPVHNKYTPNIKSYYPSTATPMLTMTPTAHGLSTIQSTISPKSAVTPNMQLFYPHSTISTAQPLYQTPMHTNYNIVVNPNGLNGQNVQPTVPTYNYAGQNDPQKKNTYAASNGQYLTSASFSVGNGGSQQTQSSQQHSGSTNNQNNNYYASTQISSQVVRPQLQANAYPVFKNDNNDGKVKTYIPTQVVQGFIQATPAIPMNLNQQQQYQQSQITNVGNNILANTWQQLQQLQNSGQQNVYNRLQYQTVYGRDNVPSTSNNNYNTINAIQVPVVKAQLPVVETQNVEIVNPNFQAVNTIPINPYGGAVVTTPFPIFSTPGGLVTPRPEANVNPAPINIQNYVDSLTQIGAQQKNPQQENGEMYNPMNFIPNMDVIQSQTLLNGKSAESLPPNLNLVPMIPGGKFYKHSHAAQAELITKPKLSSDLEKYADEMFKESLRTIYNTHKWNSDKRIKNLTALESHDLERLKQELERFRASVGSKPGKEILEAHHSETQFHTADPGRLKRPGLSVAAIEELFKTDFKLPNQFSGDSHSSASKPSSENVKLSDYLTPPRVNSFVSKSPFVDSKPNKKRPSKRPHPRPNNSRPGSLETSASNHVSHSYRRPNFGRGSHHGDYRGMGNYFDNYPTFTTSSPDLDFLQFTNNRQHDNTWDINHPRMHNLLGLLMKNKQLPSGTTPTLMDDENYQQFINYDRRRMYNEAMKHNNQINSASFQPVSRPDYHHQ